MRLKNNVAIITGGNRGIGRSISQTLAKEGATVVIAAKNEKLSKQACEEVVSLGSKCLAIKTDVSKSKDVKNLIKQTIKSFGKIDFLINNAGVGIAKPLDETSEEDYDNIMNANVKGSFLMIREVLPIMKKQKSGTIVNISSQAGKAGIPNLSVYCASKFAVLGLTQSVALEAIEHKIKVFSVCPGGVDTDMYHSLFPDSSASLSPQDVADAVLRLCLPNRFGAGYSIELYSKLVKLMMNMRR